MAGLGGVALGLRTARTQLHQFDGCILYSALSLSLSVCPPIFLVCCAYKVNFSLANQTVWVLYTE